MNRNEQALGESFRLNIVCLNKLTLQLAPILIMALIILLLLIILDPVLIILAIMVIIVMDNGFNHLFLKLLGLKATWASTRHIEG